MDNQNLICPHCQAIAIPGSKFCASCGTPLPTEPISISLGKQIWIYSVSIFAPPFGLIWFFKYFRSGTPQIKRIGIIALVLTVLSIILTVWTTMAFLSALQQQYSNYTNVGL